MNPGPLTPTSLVATTEGIRGLLFQPEKRAPLIDAGFDWAAFEQGHVDLQDAGVGFVRSQYPIRLDADAAEKAGPTLDALRAALRKLRDLAPKVFTQPPQLDALVACTVPDGTQHGELAAVDPAGVHVITLQDLPRDLLEHELPLLSKMVHVQALYLFGNGLRDGELSQVDFSRFSKLRVLALSGNDLIRFPAVTTLARLESLNLMNNPMLWHMPPNLSDMTGLRLLDLRRTGVAEAGNRGEIRAALPNCQVLL